MPKIRNNLTLLLSSKKASELLPKEGKEKLAEALKDEINSRHRAAQEKQERRSDHARRAGQVRSVHLIHHSVRSHGGRLSLPRRG
jgi:flagellar FliL protein